MMSPRLTLTTVEAIHAGLAAGRSVDVIAEQLGVSRKVIYKARRLGGYPPPVRKRRTPMHYHEQSKAYERCPKCGGMVIMPCTLCERVRPFKKQLAQARVGCIFPNPREAIG